MAKASPEWKLVHQDGKHKVHINAAGNQIRHTHGGAEKLFTLERANLPPDVMFLSLTPQKGSTPAELPVTKALTKLAQTEGYTRKSNLGIDTKTRKYSFRFQK